MSGKFSTTSSSLFNSNNGSQLPDWMGKLNNVDVKGNENMDLGIEAKGAFAEKQTVNRDEVIGTPRYLEASFNDNKIITDAKIQLAKFLAGKYYEVDPKVAGHTVQMHTKIAGLAGDFTFSYTVKEGKLQNTVTFTVGSEGGESADYPFSKAGFEECVADLRANKVKTARKVISGNPSMITLEEIVRRFNGSHREALDAAKKLVEAGEIIGVGSNTFASMYSMDDLFPQMEKEACEPRLPEFHFAPNQEHVAANPHTVAKVLAVDASKTLAEFFSDFRIESSSRDDNELLVKASVINNKGVLENADFCFGIENDRVASMKFVEFRNERMTVEQMLSAMNIQSNVLDAYLKNNPTTAKRIYRGMVLTAKEIHKRLNKIANKETVSGIIENWVDRGFITPVNSTTFTTTASFEDLLASVNTKILTADEAAEITAQQKTFGAGLDFDRQDVKDTGIRNDQEMDSSDSIRKANLYNELSKHFQNFEIRFHDNNEHPPFLSFVSAGGTHPCCNLDVEYAGNEVKKITAILNYVGKKDDLQYAPIEAFAKTLNYSPMLKAYLQNNPGKKFAAASVISKANLRNQLSAFVHADKIDDIIAGLIEERNLQSIGNDMYASKYAIAKLMQLGCFGKNGSNGYSALMSEEDRAEVLAAKAHFGTALDREEVQDTGVRDMEVQPTEENMLTAANAFLAQHFSSFQTQGYKLGNENMQYVIELFDPETGLKTNVQFVFHMDGTKVASCKVKAGDRLVSLENVKQAFATNEVLKKYLEVNPGKRVDAPMIMTVAKLINKLAAVTGADLNEIEDAIVHWERTGKITLVASNAFASRFTIEQLLSMSNLKALTDVEIKERIAKAQREKLAKVSAAYVNDNDTRSMIDEWSAERLMTFAKAELNKSFQQYDIIDVKLSDSRFDVIARAAHKGIRNKVTIAWSMKEGKPVSMIEFSGVKSGSQEVQAFQDFNKVGSRVNKGLISKSQLRNKFASVIDINKFDEVTAMLANLGMLQTIDSNTFASEYSIGEMVERLAAFKKTNLEAAKDQRSLAARDEGAIQMPTSAVMNTGSRAIEAQEKTLAPKMIELKNKIASNVDKAYAGKMITAKRHEQFKTVLEQATTEKDLENVWKEFKKYLG